MQIKRMGKNRVLVRRHNQPDQAVEGGLILRPETGIEKSLYCTVIAVGTATSKDGSVVSPEVQPGDVVIMRQWSGDPIDSLNDTRTLVVQSEFIECIAGHVDPDQQALEMAKKIAKANVLEFSNIKFGHVTLESPQRRKKDV